MVREFTELQGTMGGIYAREEGLPEEVWKAIYFHYLPVGVEADAPPSRAQLGKAAVTWAAVSLADKLDTIVGTVRGRREATGSRDPYGLRRQAHGVLKILIDLPELTGIEHGPVHRAADRQARPNRSNSPKGSPAPRSTRWASGTSGLRYVVEQRGFADEYVRVGRRVRRPARRSSARRKLEVLPEFAGSPAFDQLATTFKRVKNIARELKDSAACSPRAASRARCASLPKPSCSTSCRPGCPVSHSATAKQDYRGALSELAALGPAVDRFFVDVLVMADDPDLRRARLSLMAHLRDVVLGIADISELVGEQA